MIVDKEEMTKLLKQVPREPKDTDDWIRLVCVAPAYIIYNSKEDTGVCTRCGSTNLTGKRYTGMHGLEGKCPECGEDVRFLSEGMGRSERADYFRLLTWTRKGKTVYGRLWEIRADFREPGPPKLYKWLSALYVVNAKERTYYKHKEETWRMEEHWERYKTFHLPKPAGGMGYCWTTKYTFTYMRTPGLGDVFRKSDLKYLWIPGWCNNMPPDEMVSYIGHGMRNQSIELMVKAGFTELVMERLRGKKSGLIVNWRGKSLEKILKQPPRNVKKLKRLNPTTKEMRVFQELTEEERDIISVDMIGSVAAYIGYRGVTELRKRIERLTPFAKWLHYMNDRVTEHTGIHEWIDYIEACEKLGRNVHKNRILFPEDLKAAHDSAIAEYEAKKDEVKSAAIKAAAREERFEAGSMVILPGDTQTKLNKESAVLHHCVRTYGEKIAMGMCWIWFVRRVGEEDTPFYTLETDLDGNMRQCRGLHNKGMTEDVERFVQMFTDHLQKEIRKERRTV